MSDGVPQFARAEYSGGAGKPTCKACGQPISGAYYQVNGAVACSNCARQIKNQIPTDSHTAFARGVLFGIGGAILGPIAISQQTKQRSAQQHAQVGGSATANAPKMSPTKAVATLALLGLASPFLALADPAHGIIGFIILFVGIRIAWRIAAGRPVKILGPLNEPAAATPG